MSGRVVNIKFLIIVSLVLVFAGGCVSTKGLRAGLGSKKAPLSYIFDSEAALEKTDRAVSAIEVKLTGEFPDSLYLKRTKKFVLPLLFFNVWNYQFEATMGKENLETPLEEFFLTSLKTELDRSGKTHFDEEEGVLTLEVDIQEIRTVGPYMKEGGFIFILYGASIGWGEGGGTVVSDMTVSATMKEGDKFLFQEVLNGSSSTEVPYKPRTNMNEYFVQSMAYALSNCIKTINMKIVEKVNSAL